MEWDEPKAKSSKALVVGEDLSNLSIAELDARVAALKAEIERIEAVASAKRRHSAAASELFGKGS